MNIKQALKRKNKLVGLIQEELSKAHSYNVIEEGNPRPYSSTEAITKWMQLTDELVELKTSIHRANLPIYNKIFQLSELKNQIKGLKSLNTVSGKSAPNRWSSEEPTMKHAEINTVERDRMVKDLESKIETIQDELDTWNHNTLI